MSVTSTRMQKGKAASKSGSPVAVAAKSPAKSAPEMRKAGAPSISAEERERLIARVAYFRAEKRGFAPGSELQDWVEAEAEVLRLIGGA